MKPNHQLAKISLSQFRIFIHAGFAVSICCFPFLVLQEEKRSFQQWFCRHRGVDTFDCSCWCVGSCLCCIITSVNRNAERMAGHYIINDLTVMEICLIWIVLQDLICIAKNVATHITFHSIFHGDTPSLFQIWTIKLLYFPEQQNAITLKVFYSFFLFLWKTLGAVPATKRVLIISLFSWLLLLLDVIEKCKSN